MQISNNLFLENKIANNKKTQPSFGSLSKVATKSITKAVDAFSATKINLSSSNNKRIFSLFKKRFSGFSKDKIETLFKSCIRKNGEVDSNAADTFFQLLLGHKNIFGKILFACGLNTGYKRGVFFTAGILNALRDKDGNFPQDNLDFAKSVIPHFKNASEKELLEIIKLTKDSNGHISKDNKDFLMTLNKENELFLYYGVQNEKTKLIDPFYRKFMYDELLRATKADNIHKTLETTKPFIYTLEGQQLLTEYSELRDRKISAHTLNKYLKASKAKDDKTTLYNFRILSKLFQEKPQYYSLYDILKDKNGKVIQENIDFVEVISQKITSDKDIKELHKFSLKNNKSGIVSPEFTEKLFKVINKSSEKELDIPVFCHCADVLRNPDGEIAWDATPIFNKLAQKVLKRDINLSKYLQETSEQVRLSDGTISPVFVQKVDELMNKGFVSTIPFILKDVVRNDDNLIDNDTTSTLLGIIKHTDKEYKTNMFRYFSACKDVNGKFINKKIDNIIKIQKMGINSEIREIIDVLEKPDGTLSQTGLYFLKELQESKKCTNKDFATLLSSCKRKDGKYIDENKDAIRKIISSKHATNVATLVSTFINQNQEINSERFNFLYKILNSNDRGAGNNITFIINEATDKNGKLDVDYAKVLLKYSAKYSHAPYYKELFSAFKAFAKYRNVNSFDQLNLQQKRDVMRKIIKHQNIITQSAFHEAIKSKIIPTSSSLYCKTIGRLSHYLGISVKPLSKTDKKNFYLALDEMAKPNSEFMKLDFNSNPPVLKLSYPLNKFKNDVWDIVKNCSYSERTKLLDIFGFELKQVDGALVLSGFPKFNSTRLTKKLDGHTNNANNVNSPLLKVANLVKKFTEQNTVTVINKPEVSKQLNDIIKAFPEFLTTIGKNQHHTHDFTLDVHLLKVLQSAYKDHLYQNLSTHAKKQMQIAALFHDLTKTENEIDSHHPENSAFDLYYLLDKLEMSEGSKLKIYQIIKRHSWLSWYNQSSHKDQVAKELAFSFRDNNAFKMAQILTRADLKGVKKYDIFYDRYKYDLTNATKVIAPIVYGLQKTAINLPQTKIPKASELNHKSSHVKTINSNGIKNTVLELKSGMDLRKVGFKENIKIDDLFLLVHGLSSQDASYMFQALGAIDNEDALLSTSYISFKKENWRVFRQQGFILQVPATDIQAGYWHDFGTGYKKDKKTLFNTYLFSKHQSRTYFSNQIKSRLNLSDNEYIKLFRKIENMSITQLDKYFPKVAKCYRDLVENANILKRNYGRNYNEILVTRPKIQAVFCYDISPTQIPDYLRRFAEKNDMPIIVFPQ
ncbi:hypothetical protein J6Q66_09300 [bacterium]|nr:hypothetical protein [bacterium]